MVFRIKKSPVIYYYYCGTIKCIVFTFYSPKNAKRVNDKKKSSGQKNKIQASFFLVLSGQNPILINKNFFKKSRKKETNLRRNF